MSVVTLIVLSFFGFKVKGGWENWVTGNGNGSPCKEINIDGHKIETLIALEQSGYGIINIGIEINGNEFWTCNNFDSKGRRKEIEINHEVTDMDIQEQSGYGIVDICPKWVDDNDQEKRECLTGNTNGNTLNYENNVPITKFQGREQSGYGIVDIRFYSDDEDDHNWIPRDFLFRLINKDTNKVLALDQSNNLIVQSKDTKNEYQYWYKDNYNDAKDFFKLIHWSTNRRLYAKDNDEIGTVDRDWRYNQYWEVYIDRIGISQRNFRFRLKNRNSEQLIVVNSNNGVIAESENSNSVNNVYWWYDLFPFQYYAENPPTPQFYTTSLGSFILKIKQRKQEKYLPITWFYFNGNQIRDFLSDFRAGASFFVPQQSYLKWNRDTDYIGKDKNQFILSTIDAIDLMQDAKKNYDQLCPWWKRWFGSSGCVPVGKHSFIFSVQNKLGIEQSDKWVKYGDNTVSSTDGILWVEIKPTLSNKCDRLLNYWISMPSGREKGASDQWMPGGYIKDVTTKIPGDIKEAIARIRIPKSCVEIYYAYSKGIVYGPRDLRY